MMIRDPLPCYQEVMGGVPPEIRTHRFCPLPPKPSRPTCEGRLSTDNIHLQPVWKIILDELIRMGYIVKKEPDSDGGE
jgi:hypothetical protein